MVMNYFHLEEHGDELLIVDVAVSVQVCLLYQLLGRDSSHTQRLSKQGYWSKWRCILIVEFSLKTEHGINRFWSKWYLHFQMSYSYFCLVRRKFIAKGLHYMLQLCGHEIQFSISCLMYVNHEFWLSNSMPVPTLQQWDSIFNYMNYVNHIIQ